MVYGLAGRVWIPRELEEPGEPLLLHLSDTPAACYPALPRLLRQLKPRWIVHTGDLVDDVKLGMYPNRLPQYVPQVRRLIRMLEASEAETIWLCLGNHDDADAVRGCRDRSILVTDAELLHLEGLNVGIGHYGEAALAVGGDICLFGHSLDLKTDGQTAPKRLNGLEGIYVIGARSGRIVRLSYPAGTDDQRLGRGKMGL